MNCPECASIRTRVVLTDTQRNGDIVRRRRCVVCDHRWYSHQPAEQLIPNSRVEWNHQHITLRPADAS